MPLSQDQLFAFYEVSKVGNFTKAAENLGLTQSALSHRIKNLEASLSTMLFVRSSSGIRLTDAGSKLLKYVQVQAQIESEFMSDFRQTSTNEISGTVRIAGASTIMWSVVVPALSSFLKSNSGIRFEMMARELGELPEILKSGEADMIVTCGKQNLHQYEEVYLGDEINVLVESNKISTTASVYLDHDPEDQTTIRYLEQLGLKTDKITRCFVDDINGLIAGVEAGIGKAVLPLHLLANKKQLRHVKGSKKQKIPIYLYFLRQPFYTKLQNSIVGLLKEKSPSLLKS